MPKTTSEDDIAEPKHKPTFEDDISNLKGCDAAQLLKKAEPSLRETFKVMYPYSTYYQFKKNALKLISSNKVNHSSISKCWNDTTPCETLHLVNTHREDFFYAYAYTYRAKKELELNAESMAWPILLQAIYYIGLLDGYIQLNRKLKNDIEARSAGGIKTSSPLDPIRIEAARLLVELAPEAGWASHSAAASAIEEKLTAFGADIYKEFIIKKKNNKYKDKDFDAYASVTSWINQKEGKVREAYYLHDKKTMERLKKKTDLKIGQSSANIPCTS